MSRFPFSVKNLGAGGETIKPGTPISFIDSCGAFLCMSGSAIVETDGKKYQISRGDLYIYLVSSTVTIVEISDDASGKLCRFDLENVIGAVRLLLDATEILAIHDNPIARIGSTTADTLAAKIDVLQTAMNEWTETRPTDVAGRIGRTIVLDRGRLLLYEIAREYFAHNSATPAPPDRHSAILLDFLLSMFKNLHTRRDVAFYAEQQRLSTRYFSSVIKRKTGSLPSEIIERHVIAESKRLLADKSLSIKEVASALNFSSQNLFGKYFKLRTGISPAEHRNR